MTVKARLVVCDDEPEMREMLVEYLTGQGYEVEQAADGADLRRIVPVYRPDLVICDLRMPGEDGLSLTRWMRSDAHCAVLLLTGMGTVMDRVIGLEMGADDYLAKPFELAELRARIKSILRRSMAPMHADGRPPERMRIGRCVLDIASKSMFDDAGNSVPITSMEFDLLYAFATHAKRVLTRDQLLELAHHQRWDPYDRSIDIRISRLRKKVEFNPAKPSVLRTIRGEGYMLVPDGE